MCECNGAVCSNSKCYPKKDFKVGQVWLNGKDRKIKIIVTKLPGQYWMIGQDVITYELWFFSRHGQRVFMEGSSYDLVKEYVEPRRTSCDVYLCTNPGDNQGKPYTLVCPPGYDVEEFKARETKIIAKKEVTIIEGEGL